jgi:hypothetical protein
MMNTNNVDQDEKTRIDNPAGKNEQTNGGPTPNSSNQDKKKPTVSKAGMGVVGAGVAVGAVVGAAANYSAAAMGLSEESEDGTGTASHISSSADDFDGSKIPVANNVTDDMSFGEAFATAREETGAGGYFLWHGKWYGTYNSDEWSNMSPEYQNSYSSYPGQHYDTPSSSVSEETPIVINETEPVVVSEEEPVVVSEEELLVVLDENENPVVVSDDDQSGIEVLGYDDNADADYTEIVVEETDAVVVDFDADNSSDVVILDNTTDSPDVYEVEIAYDTSDQITDDFASNDMPDYINDGNIDSFTA